MTAAILLVAWRRPHTTEKVLEAIRAHAPSRLYVACDGPSPDNPEEFQKVLATRAIIDSHVDWDCQIRRLYSPVNQGCRIGVSRAITWFFEQEEEGIILEDDCVPHAEFFPYCEELLERYRHDERIWCISGNNFQDGQWRGDGSYYFSQYPHCWGWASWRRCWQHYDGNLSLWPGLKESGLLETIFPNLQERSFWRQIWDRLYSEDKPDSWAYRWTFTCLAMGGITALPNRNLISNIGFGVDATHTTDRRVTHVMEGGLGELLHPSFVIVDRKADTYTYFHHIDETKLLHGNAIRLLLSRLRRIYKQWFHWSASRFALTGQVS
jgi:hypothetical protein